MMYHRAGAFLPLKNQKKREPEFLRAQESREGGEFRREKRNPMKRKQQLLSGLWSPGEMKGLCSAQN